MNFFQSQDAAKKTTTRLVVYFALAIISLIVLTNILVMFVFGYLQSDTMTQAEILNQFDWVTFGAIGLGVMAVILMGSLYKTAALSGGGSSVAEMMGGKLIVNGGSDLQEQIIVNVVEEMAIASGTPVPPVYILEEQGINAFAAGFKPGDAVIGITRGAIQQLSRTELQGVIAHEFSHILHGDMRLNIRLMGILHGILIIGMIGYYVIRVTGFSGGSRRGSSRDNNGAPIFILGLGLIVLGFTGTFFGNLIKSAVSRQREFLADASAVQYTRNPGGIADALKRIGGSASGSRLENPSAAEISHSLFGEGVSSYMGSLGATHPPLDKRIRRIQPNWDGEFLGPQPPEARQDNTQPADSKSGLEALVTGVAVATQIEAALDQAGSPVQAHLDYAHNLIDRVPERTKSALHEPFGARAVMYALLLDQDSAERKEQLAFLEQHADDGVFEITTDVYAEISNLDPQFRLPLIELALPSLRQLSSTQYKLFKDNLRALIEMDHKVSLFEWSLQKIVLKHLDSAFSSDKASMHGRKSLTALNGASNVLISVLTYADKDDDYGPEAEFAAAERVMGDTRLELLPRDSLTLEKLNRALDQLTHLHPLQKPQLLKACAAAITADENISTVEAELFRAIADTLDCPMPPLLV